MLYLSRLSHQNYLPNLILINKSNNSFMPPYKFEVQFIDCYKRINLLNSSELFG